MNEKKSDRNSISFFYIDIDYGIKWKFVYYVKIVFDITFYNHLSEDI